MIDSIQFKEITADDFAQIKEVYDYYIANSTATFHTEEVSIDELKSFIPLHHPIYKTYLIYFENSFAGYCYLAPYKNRQAYFRSAEVTIYLKPKFTGKGIGSKALLKTETLAKACGISTLLGVISGENFESIKLFENLGYVQCACFKQVGEKFGRILDVVVYQKMI